MNNLVFWWIDLMGSIIAFLSSILIGLTYLFSKGLRVHPGNLILGLSLCNAMCYAFTIMDNINQIMAIYQSDSFPFYTFFSHIFYYSTCKSNTISGGILCWLNLSLCNEFFYPASQMYCVIICVDVIFTLRNPFYSPSKRVWIYTLCALFLPFVFGFLIPLIVGGDRSCFQRTGSRAHHHASTTSGVTMLKVLDISLSSLVVLFGVSSLIYALRRFKWKSLIVPPIVKTLFVRKYLAFVLVLVAYSVMEIVYDITDPHGVRYSVNTSQDDRTQVPVLPLLDDLIWYVFALALALIRLTEPHTASIITYKIKRIFTKHRKSIEDSKSSVEMNGQSYFSFVHTSLNAELVEEILVSFLEHSTPTYHMNRLMRKNCKTHFFGSELFQEIRNLSNIKEKSLINSLSPECNREQIFLVQESKGRSGSFFFFTHDKRFIIKTVTKSECETMLKILNNYVKHLNSNKRSLIARIYGLMKIKMSGVICVYVLLMNNILPNIPKYRYKYIFDLKGSTRHRYTQLSKSPKNKNDSLLLLDINFKQLQKYDLLLFEDSDAKEIQKVILRDCKFLLKENIIDYSLLLGLGIPAGSVNNGKYITDEIRNNNCLFKGIYSQDVYALGIIDFLQEYSFSKRLEHFYKCYILNNSRNAVSSVPPFNYCRRFIHFLNNWVLASKFTKEETKLDYNKQFRIN